MPASEAILIALKLLGAAEFQREARQTADSIHKVADESKKAERPAGSFSDRLKNMGGAGRAGWKGLAQYAAGGAAVYGATRFIKGAIGSTEELMKSTMALSRTTGMDTKTSSQWAELMKTRNISTSQQVMGFKGLARSMTSAQQGSKASIALFKQLGVTQEDLKKGNVNDVLMKTADAFKNNLTPIQRASAAQKLFGRTGMSMVPMLSKGSDALREQMNLASKYGATISDTKGAQEQAKRLREMQMAMDGLKTSLGLALLPVIESVTQILLQMVNVMQPLLRNSLALKAVILMVAYAFTVLKINALLAAAGFGTLDAAVLLIPLAIAAVVVAVVILYKKWGWFHRAVNNTFAWVKSHWPLLLAILTGPIGIAIMLIIRNFGKIKGAVSSAINWIRRIPGAVSSAFNSAVSAVGRLVSRFGNIGRNILNAIVNGLKSAPGMILDAIKSMLPGGKIGSKIASALGFQHGGTVMPGQHIQIVGERGPELANFRPGTRITPLNSATMPKIPINIVGGGGGGGQIVVPVYLNGREIARAVGQDTSDQKARRGR